MPVPPIPKPSLLPRLAAHLQHQGPVLLQTPVRGLAAGSDTGPGASAEWSEAVTDAARNTCLLWGAYLGPTGQPVAHSVGQSHCLSSAPCHGVMHVHDHVP